MFEKYITKFLDNTPDYIYFKDKDNIFRYQNKAAIKSFDDCIGMSYAERFPENAAESRRTDLIVMETGKSYTSQLSFETNDKGRRHIQTIKFPVYDDEGNALGIYGIARDITEKKLLEETIKDREELLSALFESMPAEVWFQDPDNNLIVCNKALRDRHNLSEDVISKNAYEVAEKYLTKEEIQRKIQTEAEISREKKTINFVTQFEYDKNENKWANIFKSPVIGRNGKYYGIIGVLYDTTTLMEARNDAESANQAKSKFLAKMSHEIRTPMNGILGFLQLLESSGLNERQMDFIKEVQSSSSMLLKIVDEILDFSKIEAGMLALEEIPFNIRHFVEDSAVFASANADSGDVTVFVHCHSDVPENLIGDTSRLKQVLNNLVNNALKFTNEGSVGIRVSLIEESDEEANLLFEIEDTGIGISKENIEKIFETFVQADDSITRKYGGTGLGLSIAKSIINMMGGEISVESGVNKGTTFKFNIRLKKDPSHKSENKRVDLSNVKALMISHLEYGANITRDFLREHNCQIKYAYSVEEALELLAEHKDFDVLMMSYETRVLDYDGRLASAIRQYKDVPLILGITRTQSSRYEKEDFVDIILHKPIRKDDLTNCFKTALKMSSEKNDEQIMENLFEKAPVNSQTNILIVEDNVVNQSLISHLITNAGYRCDIVSNGKEALDILEKSNYDLIFMDCHMPVMDGFEATKAIRELERKSKTHTPIIALTADVLKENIQKCLDTGMDGHLAKPIDYKMLLEKIEEYSKSAETL